MALQAKDLVYAYLFDTSYREYFYKKTYEFYECILLIAHKMKKQLIYKRSREEILLKHADTELMHYRYTLGNARKNNKYEKADF